MVRKTAPKPAQRPDPLWAELINSDWRDYRGSGRHEDRLDNSVWLNGFLERAGCGDQPLPGKAGRDRLRALRVLLVRMTNALRAGERMADADLAALQRALAAAPLVPRLNQADEGFTLDLPPSGRGIDRLIATIAMSFGRLLADGEPRRIKVCANPDCGWVIYDESPNRTRRWCDPAGCGNLVNVRRFRSRRRSRS